MFLSSCEKISVVNDKGKLEGKWWTPTKVDYYFNGSLVYTLTTTESDDSYFRMIFENGNYTVVSNIGTFVLPYNYIDNKLYSLGGTDGAYVVKLTNNELIIEELVNAQFGVYNISLPDDLSIGKVFYTYKGIDIFSEFGYDIEPFWYYDKKGNAVVCSYLGEGGGSNFDCWFDKGRTFFRAE